MESRIYKAVLDIIELRGTAFAVLFDPDRESPAHLAASAEIAEKAGVDLIYVGSSMLLSNNFDEAVLAIKKATSLPVIIFPGNTQMISTHADAILFLCLVSSRNPEMLIGQQVKAAPLIKELKVEPIPTGYILVESGKLNAAQFMSGSLPIPRDKPDLICAHALAAEYMGMKLVFTDAGSGAEFPIPPEVVARLKQYISIPLCVGGGLRSPETAAERAAAGADIIVVGNAFEKKGTTGMEEYADAIHSAKRTGALTGK
ncbi:MAG: geranylgeranylglyceryl/heptaprenylglyceryl phosphate synthase [candidate division Zixibacteria bacterium]|nr:geranylgeranylglyceryl/heptaprenylglyceryl phosphate synthase [candidate division Zixibacteria bacterium]